MPPQTNPILTIILSPKRVTVAEASLLDGQPVISALGDIEPPEGVFDGQQLASGDALGRVLSEFIAEKQVTAKDAVIVLPGPAAITQLIKLPSMPREDMLGAVRAVAERYAVFAEHAISVDCAIVEEIEEDGAQMSNVLFAASREANIEQCQECARTAGLELLAVEVAPIAAVRAYREHFEGSGVLAVAVVGEAKTDVMIFDEGICRLCYTANAGLPEEADTGDWMTPPSSDHDPFIPPPQLFSELTHSFRFFQNQFPRRAVQRVIVAADHPGAEAAVSHLAEQLQLPVQLGRPSQDLQLPAEVHEPTAIATRALTLAVIRGTAIAALAGADVLLPLDLIPESTGLWRPARPFIKIALAAMLVLLIAAFIWARTVGNKIEAREHTRASLQAQITALEPEIEALRAAKATELALRTQVERQTARIARERAVRWSQIMVDVSDRLPADMWLTRVASPDSSKISLVGMATNRETIPNAIQSLSGSPYLSSVVLGSLTKDDAYSPGSVVIRFQINARLLRGLLPPPRSTPEPAAEPESGSQTQPSETPETEESRS